jgi:hypothetical protein
MSRFPTLPGRVPAAAARLSRQEDLRCVAEALYEESLGDDAGSVLCELPTACTERTAKYFLSRRWQPSPTKMAWTSPPFCGGTDDLRVRGRVSPLGDDPHRRSPAGAPVRRLRNPLRQVPLKCASDSTLPPSSMSQ